MFSELKKLLYFPGAYYFRFFAKLRLSFWKPRVIVVTGSSGKTTLLNLIESQIGNRARYTHHGNSSYGIPFNILGFKRTNLTADEWIFLFLLAPFKLFSKLPEEKLYIVEADCDRQGEGKFLATLLKPEVTLWTNSTRTHSMNFDSLVKNGVFERVDEAIGHEYGHFIEHTSKLVIVNGDSEIIKKELPRTKVPQSGISPRKTKIVSIAIKNLTDYKVSLNGTEFKTREATFKFRYLLPMENFYSLEMCLGLLSYLGISEDESFGKFILPPGRSSLFDGIRKTKILDSSYNANLDSMTVILDMFDKIPSGNKWTILGDMLEQGKSEKEEHEKLAEIIAKMKLERIIFMGPRTSKYTYPRLKKILGNKTRIEKFLNPKEVLDYLKLNLKGSELLLFKGARFLEGVVENLLLEKSNSKYLCRREKVWQKRRRKWGL
ncbi:MAG: Mur ligase family protein [Patescibacteria group bacterium]|nr:Mur ligase family protein [Patescibacteria group bacterium]